MGLVILVLIEFCGQQEVQEIPFGTRSDGDVLEVRRLPHLEACEVCDTA